MSRGRTHLDYFHSAKIRSFDKWTHLQVDMSLIIPVYSLHNHPLSLSVDSVVDVQLFTRNRYFFIINKLTNNWCALGLNLIRSYSYKNSYKKLMHRTAQSLSLSLNLFEQFITH